MMDNLSFCEELLQVSKDSKIKNKLEKIKKKLRAKNNDDVVNLVVYMSLCEIAYNLSDTQELPDSVHARMLLNNKNYWSMKYFEKHL